MIKVVKFNLACNLTQGYIYKLNKLIRVDFSQFILSLLKVKTI